MRCFQAGIRRGDALLDYCRIPTVLGILVDDHDLEVALALRFRSQETGDRGQESGVSKGGVWVTTLARRAYRRA